jgi:CDGSH iron-sulfur domain-containing protein 3
VDPQASQLLLRGPLVVRVDAGRTYAVCRCGKTATAPFCDAAAGSACQPGLYVASSSKTVMFCGCGLSKEGVICDGSHKQ